MSAAGGSTRKIKTVLTREGRVGEETNNIPTREPRALVFVDVRNPVLIGSWDELGEGTTIPGPLNPGWGYSKRWKDSRDWDDDGEEEDAWEGSMSERKYDRIARETIEELAQEKQPSLPVVLAQMVVEYEKALLPFEHPTINYSRQLTEQFNAILLAAAQPLLTEHLTHLLNPPYVVKQMTKEELQRAWDNLPTGDGDTDGQPAWAKVPVQVRQQRYEWYLRNCRDASVSPLHYNGWLDTGMSTDPKATPGKVTPTEDEQLAYLGFCARLGVVSPSTPVPSFEEWRTARTKVGAK